MLHIGLDAGMPARTIAERIPRNGTCLGRCGLCLAAMRSQKCQMNPNESKWIQMNPNDLMWPLSHIFATGNAPVPWWMIGWEPCTLPCPILPTLAFLCLSSVFIVNIFHNFVTSSDPDHSVPATLTRGQQFWDLCPDIILTSIQYTHKFRTYLLCQDKFHFVRGQSWTFILTSNLAFILTNFDRHSDICSGQILDINTGINSGQSLTFAVTYIDIHILIFILMYFDIIPKLAVYETGPGGAHRTRWGTQSPESSSGGYVRTGWNHLELLGLSLWQDMIRPQSCKAVWQFWQGPE